MSIRWLLLGTLFVLGLSVASDSAAQEEEQAGEIATTDPIGYFLGISMGQQLNASGFRDSDFTAAALLAGFTDGMQKNEAALSDEQLKETQKKITALLSERRTKILKESKDKGDAYLAANAKKKDVKTLERGVQYKVVKSGKGGSPVATDTVRVHYTGRLTDGTMFDSSRERGEPMTFRVNQVIPGWQLALRSMKVGDQWMLYIPSEMAYGQNGSPPTIGPNEVLVFDVELLGIQ